MSVFVCECFLYVIGFVCECFCLLYFFFVHVTFLVKLNISVGAFKSSIHFHTLTLGAGKMPVRRVHCSVFHGLQFSGNILLGYFC